jgi:hypothetical protein
VAAVRRRIAVLFAVVLLVTFGHVPAPATAAPTPPQIDYEENSDPNLVGLQPSSLPTGRYWPTTRPAPTTPPG